MGKPTRKTHCPQGHPFNEANTYHHGNGWRSCRACKRERRRPQEPRECGHCGAIAATGCLVNGEPRCPACADHRRKYGEDPPLSLLVRRRAKAQGKKFCGGCQRTLPREHFYRYSTWLQSRCRDCQRRSHATWKRANPERLRESQRRRVESGKKQEDFQRRRARKRKAYVAPVNRLAIFERDGWRCGICGRKVSKKRKYPDPLAAALDHIIPLAAGGTHEPANVQCAHAWCNQSKSNRGGGEQLRLIG